MLVQADELVEYMSNLNLNAPQKESAQAILDGVQGELEMYCNRPLELTQIREAVRTDGYGFAALSVTPIHKVISVTSMAGSVAPGALSVNPPYIPPPMERDALIGEGGHAVDNVTASAASSVRVEVGGVYAGLPHAVYIVEYIGGKDLRTDPQYENVRTAIKRVAAREVGPMYNDNLSLRDGNAERNTEPDNRQKGWTYEELMLFDRLRRRVAI